MVASGDYDLVIDVSATVEVGAITLCPGEEKTVPYTIRNTSHCPWPFTWTVAANGVDLQIVNVDATSDDIDEDDEHDGTITVRAADDAQPGKGTIVVTATVPGAPGPFVGTGQAAVDEPEWQCKRPPTLEITDRHQTTNHLCGGGNVGFSFTVKPHDGEAVLVCPGDGEEMGEPVDVPAEIDHIDWTTTGGVPAPNGDQATVTFNQKGDYTVTATVVGKADPASHCPPPKAQSVTFQVRVDVWKCDPPASVIFIDGPRISEPRPCPGALLTLTGKATSFDGQRRCGQDIQPMPVGPASVRFELPQTPDLAWVGGQIAVGPNAKGRYVITAIASASMVDPADAQLCGDPELRQNLPIDVPEPKAKADLGDGEGEPNSTVELDFRMENTGTCQDTFDFSFTPKPDFDKLPPPVDPNDDTRFGLRVIGWRVGDGPVIANDGGSVTLVPGGSVDGKVEVQIVLGHQNDHGTITLDVQAREEQVGHAVGNVRVKECDGSIASVTHDMKRFQPWFEGQSVHIAVQMAGNLGNAEIHYELFNIEEHKRQWHEDSNRLEIDAPIEKPGRYYVKVTACGNSQRAFPNFVCYTLTFSPTSFVFDWDKLTGNDAVAKAFEKFDEDRGQTEDWLKIAVETKDGLANDAEEVKKGLEADKEGLEKQLDEANEAAADLRSTYAEQKALLDQQTAALDAAQQNAAQRIPQINAQIDSDSAQINKLLRQPPSPANSNEIARLRQEIQQLVAERNSIKSAIASLTKSVAALTKSVEEILAAIQKSTAELSGLVNSIRKLEAQLESSGELAAKVREITVLRGAVAKGVSTLSVTLLKVGGRAVPFIAPVLDVATIARSDEEFKELKEDMDKIHELEDAMKEDLENLKFERYEGRAILGFTVKSVPGGVPFTFDETYPDWLTMDKEVATQRHEAEWNYKHLVLVDDNLSSFGDQFTTSAGQSGQKTFALYAYGNLGTSTLKVIDTEKNVAVSAGVVSRGLWEEKTIELAEAKEADSYEFLKALKARLEVTFAGATLGIAALAGIALLFFGTAVAAPIAAVGVVIGLIGALVQLALHFLVAGKFASIRANWPKLK